MITEEAKVDLMCREKRELRDEIIEMQKSMHRVVFAFVSVAVAMCGLYFGEFILKNPVFRGYIAFVLIQVEFALGLFITSLIAHQNVSAGYISTLENRINAIAGERLIIYESMISPTFLFGTKGPLLYITILIIIFVLIIYISLIIIGYSILASFTFGVILTFELLLVISLLIWVHFITKQVKQSSEKWLSMKL